MMMRSKRHARGGIVLSCTALVSALAMASVVSAAEFDWSVPAGTAPGATFNYQTGKNVGDANLYGDPTVLSAGFNFNNTLSFEAVGGGGSAGLANNLTSAFLISTGLGPITQLTVREFGTWSAPGGEAPTDILNFTGIIGLQPISPGGAQQFSIFSNSIIFNQDGTWTAEGSLVPNAGFFMIGSITVENILGVEATATAGSSFEKLGSLVIVPEPTTVALLLAGLGSLALRRRRRRD